MNFINGNRQGSLYKTEGATRYLNLIKSDEVEAFSKDITEVFETSLSPLGKSRLASKLKDAKHSREKHLVFQKANAPDLMRVVNRSGEELVVFSPSAQIFDKLYISNKGMNPNEFELVTVSVKRFINKMRVLKPQSTGYDVLNHLQTYFHFKYQDLPRLK